MPIDKKTIFERTPKGVIEAKGRWGIFASSAQKILALIDGITTTEQLLAASGMKEKKFLSEMEGLLRDRLIRESWAVQNPQFTVNAAPLAPQGIHVADEDTQVFMEALAKQKAKQKSGKKKDAEEDLLSFDDVEEKLRRESSQLAQREEAGRLLQIEEKVKEGAGRKAKEQEEIKARELAEFKAREEADRRAREEAERLAREEAERLAKVEAERIAKEEAERIAREEAERKEKEEAERMAREEAERKEKEEAERLAQEEAERLAREEAERLAKVEAERIAKEEAEQIAREEAERKAQEEAERLAREEIERKEKEEVERMAREEAERKAKEEAERLAQEEAERLAKVEAERVAKEEAERIAREEADRKAREEAERLAREEVERLAQEEAERLAREEAERLAKVEAERVAKEEAERIAREEAERKAQEEAEHLAREEVERKEKEEAERQAREEAERLAKVEAERVAKEEAERIAREEAERKSQEEAERLAQEETERLARVEAERVAKEEAESLAREETERKAKEEAERLAREEAERKSQEEAERLAQEEAARESSERSGRSFHREETSQVSEEVEPGQRLAKTFSVLKWGAAGVLALLFAGLAGIHLVPLSSTQKRLETLVSARLGEPVKMQSLHIALFPSPYLKLRRLEIGAQSDVRVADARIFAGWGTLLGDGRRVERIELEKIDLAAGVLERIAAWPARSVQQQPAYQIGQITFRRANIEAGDGAPPSFRGEFGFLESGHIEKAWVGSEDGALRADFASASDGLAVTVRVRDVTPLSFLPVRIDSLQAAGTASARQIRFPELEGSSHGGKVSGSMTLSWDQGWSVAGDVRIVGANIAPSAAVPDKLMVSGKLDAALSFMQKAKTPENLFRPTLLTGSATLQSGKVVGFDLLAAIHYDVEAIYSAHTDFDTWIFKLEPLGDKQAYKAVRMSGPGLQIEGRAEVSSKGAISGAAKLKVETRNKSVRGNYTLGGTLERPTIRRASRLN